MPFLRAYGIHLSIYGTTAIVLLTFLGYFNMAQSFFENNRTLCASVIVFHFVSYWCWYQAEVAAKILEKHKKELTENSNGSK